MSREELAKVAESVVRNAEHNLRWLRKHPDRVDSRVYNELIEYLEGLVRKRKKAAISDRMKSLITLYLMRKFWTRRAANDFRQS